MVSRDFLPLLHAVRIRILTETHLSTCGICWIEKVKARDLIVVGQSNWTRQYCLFTTSSRVTRLVVYRIQLLINARKGITCNLSRFQR